MSMWITQIRDRMSAVGLSISQLSAYTGIGSNRISPFLNGQKTLDGPTLQSIYATLISLEELQNLAPDWPLDFNKIIEIKSLLERKRQGEMVAPLARAAS